jgi:hypothetical protein
MAIFRASTHKDKQVASCSTKNYLPVIWEGIRTSERLAALHYEYARHCKPLKSDLKIVKRLKAICGFPFGNWPSLPQRERDDFARECRNQLSRVVFSTSYDADFSMLDCAPEQICRAKVEFNFMADDEVLKTQAQQWLELLIVQCRNQSQSIREREAFGVSAALYRKVEKKRREQRNSKTGAGSDLRQCETYLRSLAGVIHEAALSDSTSLQSPYSDSKEYTEARFRCFALMLRFWSAWKHHVEFVDVWRLDEADWWRVGLPYYPKSIRYDKTSNRRAVFEAGQWIFQIPAN